MSNAPELYLPKEDDSVLAVGHPCHAYWTHYHVTWACHCGAVYRDECKTETWNPREHV